MKKISPRRILKGIVAHPGWLCGEIFEMHPFNCRRNCPFNYECPSVFGDIESFKTKHEWAIKKLEELDKLKYLENLK